MILLIGLWALTGCSEELPRSVDPEQVDATTPPDLGVCRLLVPADIAAPSNATRTVDCARPHSAETFEVRELPDRFASSGYGDRAVGAYAYRVCSQRFARFVGGDESLVMRTVLTWAWFRPSEKAWASGARWLRCDVVGGDEDSAELLRLPETAAGLLRGVPDDRWMICVNGATVSSPKIPCSRAHLWRAVTTIKLGEPKDSYPGDRVVEVRTRDYCSESVGAWLGYPLDYDYAYTWFHEAEWEAGNRRSICWAKTSA